MYLAPAPHSLGLAGTAAAVDFLLGRGPVEDGYLLALTAPRSLCNHRGRLPSTSCLAVSPSCAATGWRLHHCGDATPARCYLHQGAKPDGIKIHFSRRLSEVNRLHPTRCAVVRVPLLRPPLQRNDLRPLCQRIEHIGPLLHHRPPLG